tara:strand:+ start:47 stop:271 length:225 start_codon:yes stop_codon:yes gene_type:complete
MKNKISDLHLLHKNCKVSDSHIYVLKTGSKEPKKLKIRKLLKILNESNWGFSDQFFCNEKDVLKYISKIKGKES